MMLDALKICTAEYRRIRSWEPAQQSCASVRARDRQSDDEMARPLPEQSPVKGCDIWTFLPFRVLCRDTTIPSVKVPEANVGKSSYRM